MSIDEAKKKISTARSHIVLRHPFIAPLALGMKVLVTETLNPPTAAVDGRRMYFHPAFISKLTDPQARFVVAHEVFHPMFLHMTRRGGRDPLLWNIAGDYVINYLLVEDRVGELIPGCLYDKELYESCGGVTERIYDQLVQDVKSGKRSFSGQPGEGDGHSSMDNCMDDHGENKEELENEWRIKVAEAAQIARSCGQMSVAAQRFADMILKPKVDWRKILQNFVVKCRADERTWARPARRFVSQGLYRPSISGEAMGDVAVAIDCSGSIGGEQLSQFAAEIKKIKEDMNPSAIHVVYFDSEVCHHDAFSREDDLVISPHGGGGTAFSPIFRFIEENDIEPVCCVVLTDLMCNDFGPQPDYPVMWVSTHQGTAPWGEVVIMED